MTLLVHQQGHTATSAPQAPQDLPRLTTTVPREYVHRAGHAEVFLTGCRRLEGDRFALTGQWPRAHTFFTDADGTRHDPTQAAETIRQVGLLLAHSEFGVPLGHQFLLRDMEYSVSLDELEIGAGPSELTLQAVCTDVKWRGERVTQFAMAITIERDGRHVADGSGHFSCLAPAAYRRLRGAERVAAEATPKPRFLTLEPQRVGRSGHADVVLAPTGRPGHWLLSPDRGHPVLFEHGGDHVPGMVLIEAARQAACGLQGDVFVPVRVATQFHRYTEFDTPCWIDAVTAPSTLPGLTGVHVTGHQEGEEVFSARLTGHCGVRTGYRAAS
ncbi:ScbA/BarX family gamma-butyrolactone biosynthesis protein [Streptomyces sp. NRRL S-1521]|uniref:ScbA/BarX family gamma-butyrolactone biosynthesis protein n=1 Tax=Streptomyces sp. NRRL S-1521 TaxID=1609100 RepID=UPI00099E6E4E|nr:ScbA/BarX family gamma-butyrolactone biosynthesis protein [Streptomyces sp. NRRL S-1521]